MGQHPTKVKLTDNITGYYSGHGTKTHGTLFPKSVTDSSLVTYTIKANDSNQSCL